MIPPVHQHRLEGDELWPLLTLIQGVGHLFRVSGLRGRLQPSLEHPGVVHLTHRGMYTGQWSSSLYSVQS